MGLVPGLSREISGEPSVCVGYEMSLSQARPTIELAMTVLVHRSNRNRIAVTRLEGEYVIVLWMTLDLGETAECQCG